METPISVQSKRYLWTPRTEDPTHPPPFWTYPGARCPPCPFDWTTRGPAAPTCPFFTCARTEAQSGYGTHPGTRQRESLGARLPPRGRVGPFEPRKTLSPPGRSQARVPPGDRVPGRGSGPPGPLPTRRGTLARPSSWPRVPTSSLALCLCRGGRRAGKCGPRAKERTSGWRGELPVPRTGPQGLCEAGLIGPGWGPLPRGRLLVGLPALYLPRPASRPETGQLRL